MSNDLLKKVGLGVVALLVVCNTYRIQNHSCSDSRVKGFATRMRTANADHAKKGQWERPRGERPQRNRGPKKDKQEKK